MRYLAILIWVTGIVGCHDTPLPLSTEDPNLEIQDAVQNGGNEHFYFLPPIVKAPNHTGVFDPTLSPAIQICEWDGITCLAAPIVEFVSGNTAGAIQVDTVAESYYIPWHAGDFDLASGSFYRISVLVGSQKLGHADVEIVKNGSGLKNVDTDEYIGLVQNRTLMIQFRIEEGALGITIDARALSAPSFTLSGFGSVPSTVPLTVDLSPGTYSVNDGTSGVHAFQVTAAGLISYDPSKAPYLDGAGTNQLTLVGYDIVVDATPLSALNYTIGGLPSTLSDNPTTFTMLPGVKTVNEGTSGVHSFEVTEDGLVDYISDKEPYLDGAGTTQLTLAGYDIVVDATPLSALNYTIGGLPSTLSETPMTFTMLPGLKSVNEGTSGVHNFAISEHGEIDYAMTKEPYLDGVGTVQLTLVGYDIVIDGTALSSASYTLGGLPAVPTAALTTFTLLPGIKSVNDGSSGVHTFTVSDSGHVRYAAAKEPFLDGADTQQLTLVGYAIVVDATSHPTASFSVGGIGSFGTTSTHQLVMLPGAKTFASTDLAFGFTLGVDGKLDYDPVLDTRVFGRHTDTLTVN